MSYQVLARKYRPRAFAEMVGQAHVLKALTNALDSDRLHHAYLFTGTRGVGKTSLARILAKCFNCECGVSSSPCGTCSACVGIDEGRFIDLIEVDAASRAKVDETRDLMDNVPYAPSAGRFKTYLIDEVHMFSTHSFNALLKTLEEPPPHVKFLLATTEPRKLPVTILSRCLQFNLKHLTVEQIDAQLRSIVNAESVSADAASLRLISIAASGSMRDALSLLDQAIAYGDGALREEQVREMLGTIDSTDLNSLMELLATGDARGILAQVDRIAQNNPDYDSILAELLSRLHDIAVHQVLPGESDAVGETARQLAQMIPGEDVQLYYQIALRGRRDLESAPDPRTGFEMTLIRMLAFRPHPAREAVPAPEKSVPGSPVPAARSAPAHARAQAEAFGGSGDWQGIIDGMALAGLVKELAGHCVLKEHTPEKVHLILAPAQEHLLKTTQREKLQEAIRERFGQAVRLVISVEEPSAETPSERKAREDGERQEAAVRALETDPDVKAIVDMFDASLDRNSIRPRQ